MTRKMNICTGLLLFACAFATLTGCGNGDKAATGGTAGGNNAPVSQTVSNTEAIPPEARQKIADGIKKQQETGAGTLKRNP